MQVFGISVVRNESDILRVNICHHLALGIDQFLIIDNGSTDGTTEVLRELSCNGRIQWTTCNGEFQQAQFITSLAREAFLRGADWVVPIDADEFWYAPSGDFKQVLEQSSAGALQVGIVNYVQSRDQLDRSTNALLTLTMRPPSPVGPVEKIAERVEARQIGFVEILYPPKWIYRASFAIAVEAGNHWGSGFSGPRVETSDIVCLHAPLRSRSVLQAQVEHGRRVAHVGNDLAWHVRRWQRLAEEDPSWLDREWRANSYMDDCLDVFEVPHRLVFDPTLRSLLAPWIQCDGDDNDGATAILPSSPLDLGAHLGFGWFQPAHQALTQIRDVEGWLFEPEAGLLMATAALALTHSEPCAVVEIGSYCGRSTIVLGNAVQAVYPGGKVYAVDPHEGEVTCDDGITTRHEPPTVKKFMRNIAAAGLTNVVELIQQRSVDVDWQKPISFLFIDALHDYSHVSRDFEHFERWIVDGGYVAFDDYDSIAFPGVVRLVDEVLSSRQYCKVQQIGRVVVLRKQTAGTSGISDSHRQAGLPTTQSTPDAWPGPNLPGEAGSNSASGLQTAREDPSLTEVGQLRELVGRQERALATLWSVLAEETARRDQVVRERDRAIGELQAELRSVQGQVAHMQSARVWKLATMYPRIRAQIERLLDQRAH